MELVLLKGGWIALVFVLLLMFKEIYMDAINWRWYLKQKWVFLKVAVPELNERSPLAFENVLNQLHAMHTNKTWAELYIEGVVQIWLSWEVTSIGGKIGNYVRIPEKYRDTLEAAIYSQFPQAEISEAEDYFEHLPRYDPETSDFDIFAWTFKLTKPDPYPIRTYLDFEHPTADTFVDPMSGAWEEMNKLSQHEMFVIQYILRPVGNDWKHSGYQLVKKLKGEPAANRAPRSRATEALSFLINPFLDLFISHPEPLTGRAQKEEPPSLMLHLSEGEKDIITAIERSLSKWGYQSKIRCLYLAPKAVFNRGPIVPAIVGAFKAYGSDNLNSLKPDLSRWTKVNYFLFEKLEKNFTRFRTDWRKRRLMKAIRTRWYYAGLKAYILNVEEIASVLHFPGIDVTVPEIEKVAVTKVQPPPELPVAADYKRP